MGDEVRATVEFADIRRSVAAHEVVVRGRRYFLAEQDLLLDEAGLDEYAQHAAAASHRPEDAPPQLAFVDRGRRLLARTRSGKVVRWRDGLTLGYAVERASFDSAREYREVTDNLRQAALAWQEVCGVRFEQRADLDGEPVTAGDGGPLFVVAREDNGGKLIAAAFFPDDPPARRALVIDPSYFAASLPFDRVGVLRHELGHVLGFRHEHIRLEGWRGCQPEPLADTMPLTAYDSQSVMHYLCDGVGSPMLELTETDREGAQRVYGPPYGQFDLVS